ncbi:hypothetical protein COU37_04145 [Candidatus Micrarchaeota archaeon CG10_big_fil_rev_8_21_14_0_10_45_29]|nr:MAG: hypothetical protein COU37_04145 [Candidatus Micrarchaeota archaeon CG10_big_fil_rev_8_21_14_0_10_45_29]
MGSTKMKALFEIARVIIAIAVGYLIYWQWDIIRTYDPSEYAIGAGVIVTIMCFILLKKLNKGGD